MIERERRLAVKAHREAHKIEIGARPQWRAYHALALRLETRAAEPLERQDG